MVLGLRLPLIASDAELSATVLVTTVCALVGLGVTAYRFGVVAERRRRTNQRLASELDHVRAELKAGLSEMERRMRAMEEASTSS